MTLDWTTFVLEIINFLVLVWILRRLLYRPIMEMIARRRESVMQTLAQAQAREEAAQALRLQYEGRMSEWDRERDAQRSRLAQELAAEREQRLAELGQALEKERDRNRVVAERQQQELSRTLQEQAIAHAASFATRLLSRLASPELDARIVELLIEDLASIAPEQMQALKIAAAQPEARLRISSARALSQESGARLRHAIGAALGTLPPVEEHLDPELLAGVRLALGPWVLQATLADEITFFRRGVQRGD
jgi:F-type H+-transporting ATPase subunit b